MLHFATHFSNHAKHTTRNGMFCVVIFSGFCFVFSLLARDWLERASPK